MSPGCSLFLYTILSYFSQAYTAKNDPISSYLPSFPSIVCVLASHLLYQWPPPLIPLACLFPAVLKGAFWTPIICCLQFHSSYTSFSGLPSERSSTKTTSAGPWNCCEEGFEHRPTPHSVSRHQSAGDTHSEALEEFIMPLHVHQVNKFGEVKEMSPPCGGKLKWLVMAIESVLHFSTISQDP